MRNLHHHTKSKGDQGLGFVLAELLRHNIQVALPLSEHLPFDLIAISETGQLCRVSIKYRGAKDGKIEVALKSVWSNQQGIHINRREVGDVDAIAVYCPDTGQCYFLRDDQVEGQAFILRIDPPKGPSGKAIRMTADFLDPTVIFGP